MYAATPHGLTLFPYQDEGSAFAAGRDAALIADEMGLGKTIQALALANRMGATRILVLCPSSLKLNWKREAERWLAAPLGISVVQGGVNLAFADVVICNYDVLHKHNKNLQKIAWDLVVFDECHYLKNPDARRTQAALHSGFKGRKLFLSGTPIENRPIELWPILWSLDRKAWPCMHEYGVRYCAAKEMVIIAKMTPRDWANYRSWCRANNLPDGPRLPAALWRRFVMLHSPMAQVRKCWDYSGASNLEELNAKLKPFMIRRLKSEVLKDLPPKTRQVIELPADGCGPLLKHEAAALKDAVHKLKADQIDAAFDELVKARHETSLAKLPQCIAFIKDALESSEKIVVFAHHRDVLEALRDALPGSALLYGGMSDEQKDQAVKLFKTDTGCRVFLGGINAAGVGLTLTEAHHVIFVEQDWTPSKLSQAEDRCHRIGQKNNVLVQHLVLAGSLDARVMRRVIQKQETITAILDAPCDTASWATDLLAIAD